MLSLIKFTILSEYTLTYSGTILRLNERCEFTSEWNLGILPQFLFVSSIMLFLCLFKTQSLTEDLISFVTYFGAVLFKCLYFFEIKLHSFLPSLSSLQTLLCIPPRLLSNSWPPFSLIVMTYIQCVCLHIYP